MNWLVKMCEKSSLISWLIVVVVFLLVIKAAMLIEL
jgi:hypothetical protein